MNLTLRCKGTTLAPDDREAISKSIRRALSAAGNRIRSVAVLIKDINGDKGGVDKRCTLKAELDRGGALVASYVDAEAPRGVAKAANRLRRVLRSRLDRVRTRRRRAGTARPARAST